MKRVEYLKSLEVRIKILERSYSESKNPDTRDKLIRTKRELLKLNNENLQDNNIYTVCHDFDIKDSGEGLIGQKG